tara:strand:- start:393 stop:536 length:144 start_codon:yes stop_codon:yes gene_type:complete
MIEPDSKFCKSCGHLCHCVEADHEDCKCEECKCKTSDKLDEESFNGA